MNNKSDLKLFEESQEKRTKTNYTIISVILMILSAFCLITALLYYDLAGKVKDYKYIDNDEYEDAKLGLKFLSKLPIHFNIINKYFSDINNLSQQEKEEIIMAYAIKNNYKLYECGPSNTISKYLCINKEDLLSPNILEQFDMKLDFKSNIVKIYIDDYGVYEIRQNQDSNSYKIILDNSNNKLYHLYSKFDHYRKKDDSYFFYIYQGYYKGNCQKDEKLDLYDFMSGKVVYSDKCNDNHYFINEPNNNIKKLQLYKYELKKDKTGEFYLHGYNPVKNMQ